jgi:hypothetical protein
VDDPDEPGFTEPPRGIVSGTDPRGLYAIIAVLLVVIVVLAIRPWGDDDAASGHEGNVQPTSGVAATNAPAPGDASDAAPTPTSEAVELEVTCGSPSGWRAATLQEWVGRATPVRSWIAIDPVSASDPLDPAIPFAPVATGIVTAIGYCAPLDDASRPPAIAVASLWAVREGRAIPLSLLPLEPSSPDALGGIWDRPPEVTDEPAASGAAESSPPTRADVWPHGRYVVELATPGGEYSRWLGIEIADLSLLRSGPSPAAPGAAPSSSPAEAASPVASLASSAP